MAKISELSELPYFVGDETLPVVVNGVTRRATLAALAGGVTPHLQDWYKGDRGATGPANNTFFDLLSFKAQPSTNGKATFVGRGEFYFETANAPYAADDLNTIKADDTLLSDGAWVRQSGSSITFSQPDAPAVIRDFQSKMRETTSIRDFRGNDTEAAQAAVNSGAKRVILPRGDYGINTVVMPGEGIMFEGEGDFGVNLRAIGNGPIFDIGGAPGHVVQHTTLRNFSYGADISFTGKTFIRVRRAFQTYLERLRYKGSLQSPTEAIIVLDNDGGTSEQPVRVTIRDCYIDGANYHPGGGVPAPIGIWNTGGIQVIVDNTHIQDCEIGCKLGINPAIDTQYYNPAYPHDGDFYDFYFVNNSRYQVGSRGGTTTNARAFDVWKGSGVHVSNSQIYLNNNAPNPPLSGQRVARFNSNEFGLFAMEQCVVNGNARTDHMFRVAPGAIVQRLALSANEFGGLVGSRGLIETGAGAVCRAVIDPSNVFDNPNNFGPVDQRTNTAISPYDLGTANSHYFQSDDGATRTFSAFRGGTIGVNYVIQFEITGGSSVKLSTAAPGAYTGIVLDGFGPGIVTLQDGDILVVTRGPLAAAEYYRAKLIRGGALTMSGAQLIPAPLPAGASDGRLVVDSADGKMKLRMGGVWLVFAVES
jgi:hypothetical protein